MAVMDAAYLDTETRNHITGWSLLRSGMSGEAFSTALRHAALLNMGAAVEVVGLEYDMSGQCINEADESRVALVISIARDGGMGSFR